MDAMRPVPSFSTALSCLLLALLPAAAHGAPDTPPATRCVGTGAACTASSTARVQRARPAAGQPRRAGLSVRCLPSGCTPPSRVLPVSVAVPAAAPRGSGDTAPVAWLEIPVEVPTAGDCPPPADAGPDQKP